MNLKENHDFERVQGGTYEWIWEEEKEAENCIVIL